ncbi:SIR2 family protein [Massilia arenae]|uniref:SIR2 family protein n=1 Tax=Massilia arenae TaxID=2603288 RepID=A0A5C7G384_9BURK|nr:SIR2 family protein [Massilia arenae]
MDAQANGNSKLKKQWDALYAECTHVYCKNPTVEDVLTELRTLASRKGNAVILEMGKDDLYRLDAEICTLIAREVRAPLPPYRNAYNRFASWIGGVNRNHPIEIFTPNYDVLFEQAFEQHPIPHFDGFVGSHNPWFDLASIEHDVVPARWTRLWKLHGSINWEKSEELVNGAKVSRVVRVTREAAQGKVMIYPSHLKYDQSRRMPYLAMLDRLRAFFHGKDAPRLIVCGYSFLDDHLNEVLLDGLRGNRNAQCFALMYSDLLQHERAVSYAKKQSNLTVLAWDGAVVGTRVGQYRPGTAGGGEHYPWLIEEDSENNSGHGKLVKNRLGDFHYLGLFLEQLCGNENER